MLPFVWQHLFIDIDLHIRPCSAFAQGHIICKILQGCILCGSGGTLYFERKVYIMDGYDDNLAITNGLGFGVALGAAQVRSGVGKDEKLTEYEKEQKLAQYDRVMDEEERERFWENLENKMY